MSSNSSATPSQRTSAIEVRSFDYVPLNERKGKPWHQGPFWFMAQAELLTLSSGFVGPFLGLSLGWSLLAILCGSLFGTFFVAFHAAQGPQLGLPQMVQSRAQFGIRGAIIPCLMVVFLYVGFTIFDAIIAADALQLLIDAPNLIWLTVVVVLSVLLAGIGHDALHVVQRWLTYLTIVVFGVFTINAVLNGVSQGTPTVGNEEFQLAPFLTQFGVAAAYMIGFAVYISDYTRYLPKSVGIRPVVGWTYAGHLLGSVWFMGLGALLITQFPDMDPAEIVKASGDTLFVGFGAIVLIVSIPGLISIMSVNIYGTMVTSLSGVDAFKRLRPTRSLRLWGVSIVGLLVLLGGFLLPDSFLEAYTAFTTVLLYFLTPWTAINLVDFYLRRKGHYALLDLAKDDGGIYRKWSAAGITAYLIGFAAMIPFFSTNFFVGPVAEHVFDGADISFVLGLVVAAIVYWLLTRRLNLEHERKLSEEQTAQLEANSSASS